MERDRVEFIKNHMTWDDKKYLARIGEKATVLGGSFNESDETTYVRKDGQVKGMFVATRYLKLINE